MAEQSQASGRPLRRGRPTEEDKTPLWKLASGWAAGVGLVAVLFVILWKTQFAAPPGYLFGTPTESQEAGYCLAVAQDVVQGGAPVGSYIDEAARFWMQRLRDLGEPMGSSIVSARRLLAEDIMQNGAAPRDWLESAMEMCSNRAVMYGVRFRAFQ